MWFQWKWWWWQKAKQALETSIFGTKFQLTPRKTNISPENQWLEDDMSFWNGSFSGDMFIFGGAEFHNNGAKTNIFLGRFFLFIPTTSVRTTSNCSNFGTWTRKALKSCRMTFLSQGILRGKFLVVPCGSPKWRGYFRIGVTLYIFVGFTLVVPGLYHNFG